MDFIWSWFWWLFGVVGIGGIIAIVLAWPLIGGTKLGKLLVAIGLAVMGAFAILHRVRQQGVAAERARQEKENADFLARQADRDRIIAGSSDADLDRLLHDSREPETGSERRQAGVPDKR